MIRTFDPRNLSTYNVDKCPLMLHFQCKGSEYVFRYVLVERIPIGNINSATRRKDGEGDEIVVRNKYIEGDVIG